MPRRAKTLVYQVTFETEPRTGRVSAILPSLNHTADYGSSAEEAVDNLRALAEGFLEVLIGSAAQIPPSDRTEPGGVYLYLELPEATDDRRAQS